MKLYKTINVLLVEDDDYWQGAIRERSVDSQYVATEMATNKTDALRIIVSDKVFKVLICDTNLAGGLGNTDGIPVAKKFRELHPNSTIIGMSANSSNYKLWRDICDLFIGKLDDDFFQSIKNVCNDAFLKNG